MTDNAPQQNITNLEENKSTTTETAAAEAQVAETAETIATTDTANTAAPADTAEQGAKSEHPEYRMRSYVLRTGRITNAQTRALEELSPKYMVDVSDLKLLDPTAIFGREAPLVVEIGFGMGKAFIEMAANDPDSNYLGIEVHAPGVGATMLLAEEQGLNNVKVIKHDAFDVLTKCLAPESLDVLQIFFPDPWPKARQHKRRLVNPQFLELVTPLLKHGGQIRMATDWQNYAEVMLECLTNAPGLKNTAPEGSDGFVPRPAWRPLTKFEQRGERLGHGIWDLVFIRD